MASIVPSLDSNPEEKKWASDIDGILENQFQIDVKTPSISLFQVPQTITVKKPKAYEPQHIGLGPIHHFKPQPYKKMEHKKLALVRKVLHDYDIKDYEFILKVVDMVRKLLPVIRSCYDMFLQGNDDTLARIFAIDGLLLLNLFQNSQILVNNIEENRDSVNSVSLSVLHHHEPELPKVISPKRRLLAQDIIMVENQIPFMVLKEILEALHRVSGNKYSSDSANNFPTSIFRTFCEIHSPLKLCSMSLSLPSADHLLHYMYYSILNNIPVEIPSQHAITSDSEPESRMMLDECAPAMDAMDLVSETNNFAKKIPQKEIVEAYEQTILVLETFSQSKILIPSASHLHEKARYSFCVLDKYEGIKRIRIDEQHIFLPCVTLNTDSEVIFRNLVAFETLITKSDDFPLTEYVALMCALIVNVEDVKLLRTQKIIKGDLGDFEVVKLFNSLSSSMPTIKAKGRSMFQVMIDDINTVYESCPRVKKYLFLKAIGGFVGSSWKIVPFMIGIATVFYLIWQAYCDSFGCDKTTLTLLPYSSS